MKKRLSAGLIAAVMAMSGLVVPTYARYTAENSTYEYIYTEDLKATVDEGNGNIVLTWPAVDTEGKLINFNHLTADGQVNSNGCPTAGWTNPTSGMIIVYNNWDPDPAVNNVKNDNKTEHNIIKGLVDYETEWPVIVKDAQTGDFVKNAYIDTTVVANSLATAYQIQYSDDGGKTWTEDHIASTINHGKKLTRANGEDPKNTFFLEDQITEAISAGLKPETTYKIRVNAFDASNAATKTTPYKTFETEITTPAKAELTPAFPSVEGGGTYSQGGRGSEKVQGDVYVVTNLTDSVSDPQPGSLRYGLERRDRTDGNKTYPRTIVFAVGGTINVDPTVGLSARRFNVNSNTTIAGQTAPGSGITIAGASMKFNGSNIVVRYAHFRLGSGYDLDGASASGDNIVIDHCTFSYGVDETFSSKELVNSSIQYNIIDSGLSVPDKDGVNNDDAKLGADSAKHGMGSIMNGYETSFTHNLWTNNGTRNPRFEGGFTYNNVRYENKLDFANNVVYNWGHGSAYGGARGNGLVNFENNYFKSGPNTLEKVRDQLYECYSESGYNNAKSSYYISGNVMDGNAEVTADNTKGFKNLGTVGIQLNEKVALQQPYTLETAENAYNSVIESVGDSIHRDAWDNRLIEQVKNNTGYFVNSEKEAGGFNTEVYEQTFADSDSDGLPDTWEEKYGLDKNNKNDATLIVGADDTRYGDSKYTGYTNLEVYLNDLTGEWNGKTVTNNAEKAVHITAVKNSKGESLNTDVNVDLVMGETYTIETDDTAKNGFEVYLNDRKLASGADGKATFTPDMLGGANLMIKSLGSEDSVEIFSDRIPATVVDVPAAGKSNSALNLGDVNCDGEIKADDSALVLQYVLNKASVNISPQGLLNAQVKKGEIDASFAAVILQKALVSSFKFENADAAVPGDTTTGEGANIDGFISADIGYTRTAGYDFYNAEKNTLITEGNGYLGRTGSSSSASSLGTQEGFHYNYKPVSGDVTLTAKIYNWAKIDYYQFSGLMLTSDLTGTGEQYSVGLGYLKDEDYTDTKSVSGSTRFEGRNIIGSIRTESGKANSGFLPQYLGVPQARADQQQIGGWAKIVKEGQTITTYSSLDGETWYKMFSYETKLPTNYYMGFATSSAQDGMDAVTYNKSLMTDIDIQYSAVHPTNIG